MALALVTTHGGTTWIRFSTTNGSTPRAIIPAL